MKKANLIIAALAASYAVIPAAAWFVRADNTSPGKTVEVIDYEPPMVGEQTCSQWAKSVVDSLPEHYSGQADTIYSDLYYSCIEQQ